MTTGNPLVQGDFTVAAGATASNIINAAGYGLSELWIPAGLAATSLTIKQEKDALTVPAACDDRIFDADGTTEHGLITLKQASAVTIAQKVKLNPSYFHKLDGYVQLHLQAVAPGGGAVIHPVWL